jgi:CRISPR-associated protein Cmr2
MSDISKAVARSIRKTGGDLIFPEPDADLEPGPRRNVANVILAEITAKCGPITDVAKAAKAAARAEWKRFTEPVLQDCRPILREEIWNSQVEDIIEFAAAWVPLDNSKYGVARTRVMRLLAGRKACKDFLPGHGRAGVPKSSLDGLRETVLKEPGLWRERDRRRMRVREGEQLDVIGLVKRTWPPDDTIRYPSVSRVAADPWLWGVAHHHPALLAQLRNECAALGNKLVRELDVSDESGHPHYAEFPFEGSAVFPNRHHEMWDETRQGSETIERSREKFLELEHSLAELIRVAGEPNPYLAIIVADGDRVGETISSLASPTEHRTFSGGLARFASKVKDVINQYRGVLVYAGGDDVLAFVPVDTSLDCARDLHDTFGVMMAEVVAQLNRSRTEPIPARMTLSMGVAIGHFLENLEDLLEYGRLAEKAAKIPDADGRKDSLAVHLHKRGGGPVLVRNRWTESRPAKGAWATAPDTRITGLAAMLHERLLPSRLATDLKQLVVIYETWPRNTDEQKGILKSALSRDILRVIAAKQPGAGGDLQVRLQPVIDRIVDARSLEQLTAELLIARQLAVASRQAGAHRGRGEP